MKSQYMVHVHNSPYTKIVLVLVFTYIANNTLSQVTLAVH